MNDTLRARADEVEAIENKFRKNWERRPKVFLFPVEVDVEEVVAAISMPHDAGFSYSNLMDGSGQILVVDGGFHLTIHPESWTRHNPCRYEWRAE